MTVPVIQTRRLTLRPILMDDTAAITRGMVHWDVVQWLTAPPFPYAHDDAVHFVTEIVPSGSNWAIDAGDGLIGAIGVAPDLGYWLDVEYHGQHIMSEATQAIVAWYFENTSDDLLSGHHVGNGASRAVLQKLGFDDTHIDTDRQTAAQEDVQVQHMILSRANWDVRDA